MKVIYPYAVPAPCERYNFMTQHIVPGVSGKAWIFHWYEEEYARHKDNINTVALWRIKWKHN